MKPNWKNTVGALHRLAYATAISAIVWLVSAQPLNVSLKGLTSWTIRILDLPIATASQLLPCDERGLDLWYRVAPGYSSCPHNPGPEFFGNHMRIGVPAYLALFYLPNLLLAARRRWRRSKATVAAVVVVLALIFAAAPAFSAGRGPSTPDERSKAVNLVRALEADPLNEGARDSRRWLVAWLSEIPDITVQMCPALLGENFEVNKKYAAELALQQSLSSAAFIIEHPDRANDKLAVSIAGVEGVFKAYEAILAQKPKAHFKSLDALIEAKSKGALESIIAQNVRACT